MHRGEIRETYLRKPAPLALQEVQEELISQNLGLKIWDAYRPVLGNQGFWELIKDDRYVGKSCKEAVITIGVAQLTLRLLI